MRRTSFLTTFMVICLLGSEAINAQINLVVNPSFEDTIQCVPTHSRFDGYVSDWRGGRGEYYNQNCQGFQVEVPVNGVGTQVPHSGSAYAGIYTAMFDNVPSHDNGRDYIEGRLDTTLIRGQRYYVGMYVSLAEINQYVTPVQFRFTSDTLSYDQYVIPMTPSVEVNDMSLLSDTAGWVWVSGYYTASGMESHLVIGNFLSDSLTPYLIFNSGAVQPTCYYYIDDVAVYAVADANAGNDVQICLGDSIPLGSSYQNGVKYTWSSQDWLSDSTSPTPYAKPLQTTTFILTVEDTTGQYYPGILTDSVTIFVDSCKSPAPPENWNVSTLLQPSDHFLSGNPPGDLQFSLFDGRGRLVFHEENFTNSVTADSYAAGVYVIEIKKTDGTISRHKVVIAAK